MQRIKHQIMHLITIATVFSITSGCMTGPFWNQEISFPQASPHQGRTIIVSNFLTADRAVSATYSDSITTILESVSVKDMSNKVAQCLTESGITAEARADWKRRELKPDTLLLSGAFLGVNGYQENSAHLTAYFLTLGLMGLWLPSPITYDIGTRFHYRVQLIDSEGRYLLNKDDGRFEGYYKANHILSNIGPTESRELKGEAFKQLCAKLVSALGH